MAKLDNQNRLIIPKNLLEIAELDIHSEVRLYIRGKELYFDTASHQNNKAYCIGTVKVQDNGRFHLPKLAREILNCKPDSNFTFYLYDGKIFFKKLFFIPEIR